jgi:hypothetical protein
MELAQENKKKQNLEVPAPSFKGITSANPFSVLQNNAWLAKARQVGIVFEDIDPGGTDESILPNAGQVGNVLLDTLHLDNNSNLGEKAPEGESVSHVSHNSPKSLVSVVESSPRMPSCAEVQGRVLEDSDLLWTKICRNRRGKHPRTKRSP